MPTMLEEDDPCAACTATAEAISRRIANERPRNHVDLRHRTDPAGNTLW